ncbi:hypothetical protein Curi_c12710 [Gottschalkia acidurici 9a]|uniref:Uncharacterized protein n=1 Tax=Gottschalkia acidurici (strain ATCC 7906 / DSM 604 / BCRC 14475 / CIP 104303 / KCTC 5404 / NCIMB 10678 / 9a) TaxID=1128398 RepID=K0AZS1_GOTA9|nr:hypothetical protein [Gottschalkia acidurici]AFS78282.1 hypothetical protein Curi_c12710 [Gottschalkia acidurici 9a]
MGITEFVNHAGESETIVNGTKVIMIGGGGATGVPPSSINQDMRVDAEFGDPTLAYRILVTISDESELITGGYMKKGSQSATQGASEKYLKNTSYNIVLPKLKATFARMCDYTGTYPDITITDYHDATLLELKEIGKNGVETGKITTTKIIGPDNSNIGDALIMSPTGVVGSGNGQSGYWKVTSVKKEEL